MNDEVLHRAYIWGFVCDFKVQGEHHILPQEPSEGWKLESVGDKWILYVNNVPQILCHPPEAVAFLERRRAPGRKTLRQLLAPTV